MKRAFWIYLVTLALLGILAACRGAGDAPPPASPTADAEDTATPEPAAARGDQTASESELPTATSVPDSPGPEPSAAQSSAGFSLQFQPRPDGLGFRNYGAAFPEGDFTIAELRTLFGDEVCSRIDGERCVPTAAAQQWIADRNADMIAGHCIGFTVASYRFLQGDLQPDEFTPAAAVPFQIDQQVPIMRTLAANGALYWAPSVWQQEVSGTPAEIIDALIELGEPVDLSIFLPGLAGGHSLLAYGLEEVAPDLFHILVYDNNFPGEEAFVEVDVAANTWRYDRGAENPEQTAVPYEGDAETNTLRFIPLSAYENVSCPFCAAETEEDGGNPGPTLLSFLGDGDVLVKTLFGSIGSIDGELINEIPGAHFIFQRGQFAATDIPDILLPEGIAEFSMDFNGLQRVSSLNTGFSVVVDQLDPAPEDSRLAVAQVDKGIEFTAGGAQTPVLKANTSSAEAAYRVALLGVKFADGQSLAVGAARNQPGLEISRKQADTSSATLLVARLTEEGEALFVTSRLHDQQEQSLVLDLPAWDGEGSLDVYVDRDGDGTFDTTPLTLTNAPLSEILRQEDAPALIDDFSPYLGEQGLDAVLATLPAQRLSPTALAAVLRPLHLSAAQYVALLPALDLPTPQLAALLSELRLETDLLEEILAGLQLTAVDETALRAALADLAAVHGLLADWAFLNSTDLDVLAALINDRGLTLAQLQLLFPRLGLSPEDLAALLAALDLADEDRAALALELPPTAVPTAVPTATRRPTATPTRAATPTPAAGSTATPTADPLLPTVTPGPAPQVTPGTDPYPGPPPASDGAPDGYPGPYPGPATRVGAYPAPAPDPTATPRPVYESGAFCDGDNLQVRAGEPGWNSATITLRSGPTVLLVDVTGPAGEPFTTTLLGPATWPDLVLESSAEPARVPLGSFTCP